MPVAIAIDIMLSAVHGHGPYAWAVGQRQASVRRTLGRRWACFKTVWYSQHQEGHTLLLLLSDQSPGRRPGLWSFNSGI